MPATRARGQSVKLPDLAYARLVIVANRTKKIPAKLLEEIVGKALPVLEKEADDLDYAADCRLAMKLNNPPPERRNYNTVPPAFRRPV